MEHPNHAPPTDLPPRASIRENLRARIARFMEEEKRNDFSDAVCALVDYGLDAREAANYGRAKAGQSNE